LEVALDLFAQRPREHLRARIHLRTTTRLTLALRLGLLHTTHPPEGSIAGAP
jgi:hypothetical protein